MINRMLGHKTILNKFKRIKIISSFFSDHSGMKLEVNYLSKVAKYSIKSNALIKALDLLTKS